MSSKKNLILTYSVTPDRQRTVVLPLSRVNALMAALGVMIAWSLGSAVYILTAEPQAVVAVVPQFTPTSPMTPAPAATVAVVPRVPLVEVASPEVAVVEPATETSPAAVETSPAAAEKPGEITANVPKLAAALENYSVTQAGEKFIANFGVRNLSNGILRGKVIAEAEFIAEDGTVKTVTAVEDYKARILSAKQLHFRAPGPGKFTKMRITVNDKASQRAVVFFK